MVNVETNCEALEQPTLMLLKQPAGPTKLTPFAPNTAISPARKDEASNEIVLCYASSTSKTSGSLSVPFDGTIWTLQNDTSGLAAY